MVVTVFYGCEDKSVTFGEDHRLKAGKFEVFMRVGGSDWGLLGYDIMQSLKWIPIVLKSMVPTASESKGVR
jgi:hypothetical protein